MTDTNYFSGIVKILENPKRSFLSRNILLTTFRGEIAHIRKNKLVTIKFWGNLAQEVKDYYEMNDYILIEGYLSIKNTLPTYSSQVSRSQLIITVLKVYPFLLKSNRGFTKL